LRDAKGLGVEGLHVSDLSVGELRLDHANRVGPLAEKGERFADLGVGEVAVVGEALDDRHAQIEISGTDGFLDLLVASQVLLGFE